MRIKKALAAGLLGVAPALTGCLFSHTRSVPKILPAPVVMETTLDHLLQQVDAQYDAIQTMNATVEVVATTGNGRKGEETRYPSFSGYIFMRKPRDLRVLLRVPVLGSTALDMVSDGKTWKLWVPRRNLAMTGTSEVTKPSANGLENLRPAVFLDSLLIQGRGPDQVVSLTGDSRILPNPKNKKEFIEEPDYQLEILAEPSGQTARAIRVIHIGRSTLLPYQQDLYSEDGKIVTRAFYSNYQKFGDISFPTKIEIRRPLDQLSLTLTITKLTFNQKLEDDQFDLKIPDTVPIKNMN